MSNLQVTLLHTFKKEKSVLPRILLEKLYFLLKNHWKLIHFACLTIFSIFLSSKHLKKYPTPCVEKKNVVLPNVNCDYWRFKQLFKTAPIVWKSNYRKRNNCPSFTCEFSIFSRNSQKKSLSNFF